MKKTGAFIAAGAFAASAVFPLYSSAAIGEAGVKKEAYSSGFSFAPVHVSYSDENGSEGIALMPEIGGVSVNYSEQELPDKFDLRDINGVTPVKDQGSEGTCWAQSSAASAETSLIKYQPQIDLSEYHTAFFTYYGADQIDRSGSEVSEILNMGGNAFMAANLWSQWVGPVKESRMPYGDMKIFGSTASLEEVKYMSDYHMSDALFFDYEDDRSDLEDVNCKVKELVYGGYGVAVSFQPDVSHCYSSEFNSSRSERKPRFASHSVTIVGWDDSFPKENFVKPADFDGAWLVKNSWGEDSFDNGYLWISYDDRSLCEFTAFLLEDNEEYTINFHHDTHYPSQSMSAYDEGDEQGASYMANIFYTEEAVQAEAVSIYATSPGTEYGITIYSGLTDIGDPTSGTASAETAYTSETSGYITVPLSSDVLIPEGSFSVVVRAMNEKDPFVIPVEAAMAVEMEDEEFPLGVYSSRDQIRQYTAAGESFYSSDGSDWSDVTELDYVFSDEDKNSILDQLETELFDGIYPDETDLLEKAEESFNMYKQLFSLGDLTMAVGNIPVKVLANPADTVDFSQPTGFVPENERLELSVKDGSAVYYSVNGGDFELYTEPLEITGLEVVRATTDFASFTERSFISAGTEVQPGDVDLNGKVDASDAGFVLVHYSDISTGGSGTLPKAVEDYADYDGNGRIDASDASCILMKYAENSVSFN
ncbi:MAG: lectin like domain-containing protein [Alistipes sp.]|nr:lectin like domain-containing protein [Alistipes sp.]